MMDEWTRAVMLATGLRASEARKIVSGLPAHVLNHFPCPPVRDSGLTRRSDIDFETGRQNDELETLLYLMSLDLFNG